MVQLHAIMIKFLELYPEVKNQMENAISRFAESPDYRDKTHIKTLLLIPVYILFTEKYSFQDICDIYLEEHFARRIFWILCKVPNLDFEAEISREHMIVGFKASIEGYRMILMINQYINIIKQGFKSCKDFLENFEENKGKMPKDIEQKLNSSLVSALQVESYREFFSTLGVERSDKQIFSSLKNAFLLSKKRGYHGDLRKSFALQKTEFTKYSFNVYNPMTLLEVYTKYNTLDIPEDVSKEIVVNTFLWVRRSVFANNSISPAEIACFSDNLDYNFNKVNHTLPDPKVQQRELYKKRYLGRERTVLDKVYKEFTWKELMVKLLFEKQIRSLQWDPNFKSLHESLDILKNFHFQGLTLYLVDIEKIKMKYYYLTIILKKVHSFGCLQIKPSCNFTHINVSLFKELVKGFNKRTQFPSTVIFSNLTQSISENEALLVETFVKCFEKINTNLKHLVFDKCDLINKFPSTIPFWKYIMGHCPEIESLTVKNFHLCHLVGFDDGIMNL